MKDKLYLIVVCTLAGVMIGMIAVLLVGLFDERVDNDKILAILAPAFQTIVGCFVGVLGSRILSETKPPEPPANSST